MDQFKYLIPEESTDIIMSNVSLLREIENHLRDVFNNHDCLEVLMPSFEYVDLYNDLDMGINEEKMFQYINHEGKHIALRSDFTVPLARLYCNQNENGEKRYSYFGKVYRKEKRHKGRSSEHFQAGVELIGKGGYEGDIECLHMIQETLSYLKLDTIKIELSSATFYKRLCELVDDESFVESLKKRDVSSLSDLIEKNQIQSPLKELILKLPRSFGGIDVLDDMIEIVDDEILLQALNELKKLYMNIDNKEMFSFDLAMSPSMEYYTGLIIKGYTPYSAETIINGGRYDQLMNHFKKDIPAIGFSYDLTHILNAIEREVEMND